MFPFWLVRVTSEPHLAANELIHFKCDDARLEAIY